MSVAAGTLTRVSDYEYELRREGEIVATGRIQLDEVPAAGDSLRLGSHRVRIAEVLELGNGPRLILAPA
jgi:hypothetical protein